MRNVVIFGTGTFADVVFAHLSAHPDFNVAGFTADSAFIDSARHHGLPLVPFEKVNDTWPPSRYAMLVAIAYARLNQVRRDAYLRAKEKHYEFATYVDPTTRIFECSPIGENTVVLDHNSIQPYAEIGSNVVVWSGNVIGHHSVIRDHCCITSHVAIGGSAHVGERSFIGANATIRDGVTIGESCLVGAGCVVLENAPAKSVYRAPQPKQSLDASERFAKIQERL